MKRATTGYQYPFPQDPEKWGYEERAYSRGLRNLFDILFARKLTSALIADDAITSRNIKEGSIGLTHVVTGFGKGLDISENETIAGLDDAVIEAQGTADDAQDAAEDAQTAAEAAQGTADDALEAANTAQSTADGLKDLLMPVGITVISATAPSFGTWTATTVDSKTAWTRTT